MSQSIMDIKTDGSTSYVPGVWPPQLEEDKALLQSQKREAEQEKLTLRDELVRLEQSRLEVDSARGALGRTLQDVELGRAAADAELHVLRGERLKLQDKVTQVLIYHEWGSSWLPPVTVVPRKSISC